MTKQNIKGDFYMCLINCNIVEIENKEVKRNSDITYCISVNDVKQKISKK